MPLIALGFFYKRQLTSWSLAVTGSLKVDFNAKWNYLNFLSAFYVPYLTKFYSHQSRISLRYMITVSRKIGTLHVVRVQMGFAQLRSVDIK